MRAKLPPYGRALADRLVAAKARPGELWSNGALLCALGPWAWEFARAFHPGRALLTLLPPGDDPARIDWSPLAAYEWPVWLVPCDWLEVFPDECLALASALLAAGVPRVIDLHTLDCYRPAEGGG